MHAKDAEFRAAVARVPTGKRLELCTHLLNRLGDQDFMALSESQNKDRRGVAKAWRSSILEEAQEHLQRDDYESALSLLLEGTCWWFATEFEERASAEQKEVKMELSNALHRASDAISLLVVALHELQELGFNEIDLTDQLASFRNRIEAAQAPKKLGRPVLLETELAKSLTNILVAAGFDGSSRSASQKAAASLAAKLARHYDIHLKPRALEVYASELKAMQRLRLKK